MNALRKAISDAYLADEDTLVERPDPQGAAVTIGARRHRSPRARSRHPHSIAARTKRSGIDAFTQEYALSSEEGVVLMCLAESLLRVPDAATADR